MAHTFACDFHPGPYPQEEREHTRRTKYEPSLDSDTLTSLKVILQRLMILGVDDGYSAVEMEKHLNKIGIACVTDLYNMMTKDYNLIDYETITRKFEEHGIARLKDKTIMYLPGMAEWINTRYNADHEYYLQMEAIVDEENEYVMGGLITCESQDS